MQTICDRCGTHHGRILVLNNECAKESTGHGSPLPLLVHGGPGRAGGGEEMGDSWCKTLYAKSSLAGFADNITAITDVYQPHAKGKDPGKILLKNILKNCRSVTRS